MSGMSEISRAFSDRLVHRRRRRKGGTFSQLARGEALEKRLALFSPFPIQVTQIPSGSGPTNGLEILYSQGGAITADQHVVIDIDRFFAAVGGAQTRINVYASTNPAANGSQPGTAYTNIDYIRVVVPNFDAPGTNNNSLTIKGIGLTTDRIIVSGSGRTAAGRWSDESGSELQVAFDIEGIDDTTVTAGGVINVSGAFTNDTGDASIHAIGDIAERSSDQQAATIIIGETTTADPTVLPHPRLVSDFVEIIGAELDIYSDIVASRQVILRAAESAATDSRSNLVLPYDIQVLDPVNGVLELHSTRNITQLQSSTITARKVVAVSNNSNPIPPGTGLDGNPWNIDLGSTGNDFDEVAIGMIAAPGDKVAAATQGRIGIRDIDDLRVSDFGILALTGQVTLRTGGQLTFDSSVQARGLVAQSDFGIESTTKADMRILGVPNDDATAAADILLLANKSAAGAAGDITLNSRIDFGNRDGSETSNLYNIRMLASGTTTVAGGLFAPVSTQLVVESDEGIVISGPIQMGSTTLDPLSKASQVFRGGISLVSNGIGSNGITIANRPGNSGIPQTLNASEAISLQSTGDITIEGTVLAGSVYGDPASLTKTASLPSITMTTPALVALSSSSSLQTIANVTDPDATSNPLVGLISINKASQVVSAGRITADGAIDIDVVGDVSLAGPTTARENVVIATSAGSIDVQAAVVSTGGTYSKAVVAGSQREPNVVLSAPNGSIATSNTGTLRAGVITVGATKTFGTVTLSAQQDIDLAAAIDTPGAIDISSKLGQVILSALVRTSNSKATTIDSGNGVLQADKTFSRLITDSLTVANTGSAGGPSDIDLSAINNQIKTVIASNFSLGGDIAIRNNGALAIGGLLAQRDELLPSTITLASTAGITQTAAIQANDLVVTNTSATPISLTAATNNVDRFAANNPTGAVSYVDTDDFETGVVRGAPLGVELRADSLALSSVAPFSTIRVVSGLQYRTLSLAAGTQSSTTAGTVELVTTSAIDNPATKAPFAGTLRDMIRYANDNAATYVINNTRKAAPMAVVFDESDYLVEEISLSAALPTIVKPLRIDGGRLEKTAEASRVGILGTSKISAGLTFGVGSSGSAVDQTAIYGFTAGTGLVLNSANNTVTSSFIGLKADGVVAANRVGLEMTGGGATGNLVGTTVFDRDTANRIGGNTEAGILIRDGANGNRVFGNVIGLHIDASGSIGGSNGDGIRISKASGNEIGTPDAVKPDLTSSISNIIAGNASSGVHVLNSAAGSFATANSIRNNLVSDNSAAATASGPGAGIMIRASKFALIGGDGDGAGNVIVGQAGAKFPVHAVAVTDSTDVRVYGNSIGVEVDGVTLNGNTGDGVNVLRSQRVDVAAGNVIAANSGHGVAIGTGSSAVTVAANRIGLLSDDSAAGNLGDGVAISTALGNTIGAGNLIANNANGVSVANARATVSTSSNRILGSEIFANLGAGVRIVGGSRTMVGGTAPGNGNVIRENIGAGILVEASSTTGAATGHLIQGNLIGTNTNRDLDPLLGNGGEGIRIVDGVLNLVSAGNTVLNNGTDGIRLVNGTGNIVGGNAAVDGNVISANGLNGISIQLSGAAGRATGHRISGNAITGNARNGVELTGSRVTNVWIGQDMTTATPSGRSNVITDNGAAGVRIDAAQQISVQGNSIADNTVAGIQLANNANTSAATALSLSSAIRQQPRGSGPQVVVSGSLRGLANQQYSIDLYANPSGDGNPATVAGYQGRRLIGRLTVTADRTGLARFTFAATADVLLGDFVTATATSLRFGIGATTPISNGVEVLLPRPSAPRR